MAAASTDYFTEVGNPGSATTLAAPGHTIAGTSFTVVSTANWPTLTGVVFAVDTYTMQVVNGVSTAVRTPGSYTEWEGVVSSSTQITGAVLRYGTDQNYSAGSTTRVYIPVASSFLNRFSQGVRLHANQDGSLITSAVQTALGLGTSALNGWNPLVGTPNTVTYNGNRSYTCVFNSTDLTATLSPGMRLRTTRTVAAPTQSTSLNGTTQYWSKTSPAGMTFTDDFATAKWIKISAYPSADAYIESRWDGTNGWGLAMNSSGQIFLAGYSGGAANNSRVTSYQSVPLNKWVHIGAQLDMSAFTASPTTSYVMIDGADVPASVTRGGTNPTALVQGTGAYQLGALNGGSFFGGKIESSGLFSAKVTQSTMQSLISQGIPAGATALVSAYSFDANANDINTTNANNLTANGSAVATNADSPFGGQAGGTISSTLDYGIIQSVSFSTNTTVVVQVPEGCTIPTSGGVSAVAYSSVKVPYGFPGQVAKWEICSKYKAAPNTSNTAIAQYGGEQIVAPIGEWELEAILPALLVGNVNGQSVTFGISTATGSITEDEMSTTTYITNTSLATANTASLRKTITATTQTIYYVVVSVSNAGATANLTSGTPIYTLRNAYL